MKHVQRYTTISGAVGPTISGGDWVKHEDYAALEAEVRRLREDAGRYRWLRDEANGRVDLSRAPLALMTNDDCSNEGWRDVLQGAELDAAIDAARAKDKP
jgi:hypothetical protein